VVWLAPVAAAVSALARVGLTMLTMLTVEQAKYWAIMRATVPALVPIVTAQEA
jgi:hypothetical protein